MSSLPSPRPARPRSASRRASDAVLVHESRLHLLHNDSEQTHATESDICSRRDPTKQQHGDSIPCKQASAEGETAYNRSIPHIRSGPSTASISKTPLNVSAQGCHCPPGHDVYMFCRKTRYLVGRAGLRHDSGQQCTENWSAATASRFPVRDNDPMPGCCQHRHSRPGASGGAAGCGHTQPRRRQRKDPRDHECGVDRDAATRPPVARTAVSRSCAQRVALSGVAPLPQRGRACSAPTRTASRSQAAASTHARQRTCQKRERRTRLRLIRR